MFSFLKWSKPTFKKQTVIKPELLQLTPCVEKQKTQRSEDDEKAIIDLLFKDVSTNLRIQTERAEILCAENNRLCAEVANLMAANVQLHSENARLQDVFSSNATTFKTMTSFC